VGLGGPSGARRVPSDQRYHTERVTHEPRSRIVQERLARMCSSPTVPKRPRIPSQRARVQRPLAPPMGHVTSGSMQQDQHASKSKATPPAPAFLLVRTTPCRDYVQMAAARPCAWCSLCMLPAIDPACSNARGRRRMLVATPIATPMRSSQRRGCPATAVLSAWRPLAGPASGSGWLSRPAGR